MKNYVINEELANAVFNYLSQQPYREVAGIMAGLGQLPELVENEETSERKGVADESGRPNN